MGDDEKMFQIGAWSLGIVLLMTVALQVVNRTQDRTRNRVRADIVKAQQDRAVEETRFASYVRPEVLRNTVTGVYPRAEAVGFTKTISISDLPE